MEEGVKYISLQNAVKFCDYSQEYLSLRARQGKLKSVKFGRNWVTTKEWLDEYLEKFNGFGATDDENEIDNSEFDKESRDNFIRNKKQYFLTENFSVNPEIVQEASLNYKSFFSRAAKISAAIVSVALMVFFSGIIFSSLSPEKIYVGAFGTDRLLKNIKADVGAYWDKLGKTTEITAENTAIIRANINGNNYECKCDLISR